MGKGRKALMAVLIAALAAVAACCFLYCARSAKDHADGNRAYKDLAVEFIKEDADTGLLDIDWDDMQARYPEIVGWIYLDSDHSYPVVRHSDNSWYLTHGPDGEYNVNGAIFMSSANSQDWTDRNTVVYGHNMNSGAMFGSNKKYRDPDYVSEHPYFYIYTPQHGCLIFRIYAVAEVEDATRPYETFMETDAELGEYLDDVTPLRLFDTGVAATEKDSVVSLSTCAKHNTLRRLMIQGVRLGHVTHIPDGEPPHAM